MSLIARTPALRQTAASLRGANQVRFSSSDYHHLPFKYNSKSSTAVKVAATFVVGFFTPFVAAVYQIKKASAA